MDMSNHLRKGLISLGVGLVLMLPSLGWACTITHDPEQTTETTAVFKVRIKPGERCVIGGDGKSDPWFLSGEKKSAYKGLYDRLIHELHNKHDPKRARWQYVYVAPKNWTGHDSVSIGFEVPRVENRYDIVVAP